ncbi:MAG: methyltransferase domain-containing protein [Actinobacteria bacterium]|nr:methyltransferase domain-containing protein [Actinomycetota bacterium]
MPTGTEEYYAQRAAEYDRVYEKPERQGDIAALTRRLATTFAGRDVLDVAGGTAFWTERFADATSSTTVCDVNEETLAIARARRRWPDHTRFVRGDAFALEAVPGRFDAAFVGFFCSHVAVDDLDHFLDGLCRRLAPGATVVLVDNTYVEGSNHPITRTDEAGNTYQRRRLADGRAWEVRKNFPTTDEVAARLAPHGAATVTSLSHFWVATLRLPRRTPMPADTHGGDHDDDDEVTARYLAHRNDATRSPNVVMEEPAVLAHLGDLRDRRVIDLGCGDGAFADIVLDLGARSYLGRDRSASMIAAARRRNGRPGATYEVGTIESFSPPDGTADLVTSRMALHHLEELGPTLRTIHRALSPAGRLLLTVAHPVITAPREQADGRRTTATVDDYFEAGERRRPWFGTEVTWYHRTVEDYVAAVLDAGFEVDGLSECEPDPRTLAHDPDELARRRRVPLILLVSARRPT